LVRAHFFAAGTNQVTLNFLQKKIIKNFQQKSTKSRKLSSPTKVNGQVILVLAILRERELDNLVFVRTLDLLVIDEDLFY
jgi:hypothetical protein